MMVETILVKKSHDELLILIELDSVTLMIERERRDDNQLDVKRSLKK
jgi:hypothetical protein